jgi:hypothetical protein
MTGDQQERPAPLRNSPGREDGFGLQQSVDAAIAGHLDCSCHALALKVAGRQPRRREQQRRCGIDAHAIALFRPRLLLVERAQPGLDMGKRNAKRACGDCAPWRSRCYPGQPVGRADPEADR